jgi:hypothetical protein
LQEKSNMEMPMIRNSVLRLGYLAISVFILSVPVI